MNPNRWQQVDQLLDDALELPPEARPAFLDRACAGDDELRREVESLLEAHEQPDAFLDRPALEVAAKNLAHTQQTQTQSLLGKAFGPYQIISLLGVGGMGEVYLAEDTRLRRRLTIKLLPAQFTQDQSRVYRFAREARAASALTHPNIITIYDIGQNHGQHFIAAEFIEGQTLREALTNGPLPPEEVIEIGQQIASALAAAHQAGIVHRDIKPENIMRRTDGYVKVLDFGLARMAEGQQNTYEISKTTKGLVLGTVSYMSPEQALGEDIDTRSDLFSLGVVLYELCTGQQPFTGSTPISVADKIIHQPHKPLTEYKADLPPGLTRVIHRALEKEPTKRYQSATELRADLQRVQRALDQSFTQEIQPAAQTQAAGIRPYLKWLIAAVAFCALSLTGLFVWRKLAQAPDLSAPWADAQITELTEFAGVKTAPSISPDGQFIVYARKINNQFDLFLQRVGGSNAQNLTSDCPDEDTEPAFSPDGAMIAFRSDRDGGGIYVIGATGENLRRVASGGFNPSWSPDGNEILYATQRGSNVFQRVAIGSELWAVNWRTGATRRIEAGPDAVQPRWSPNGHRIAFWGLRNGAQRDLWTIPSGGGAPVAITNDIAEDCSPAWSPDGQYLYFSSNRGGRLSLWQVRIDERTGQMLGQPQPLSGPSHYSQFLTVSRDGKRMAYANRIVRSNIRRVPFDPERAVLMGESSWATQLTRRASNQDVSPDGQWLTFFSFGDPQFDIYVSRVDGSEVRQLTDDRHRDRAPRWSPDGSRIAFFSDQSGKFEIWTIRPDGGERRQLTFSVPDQPGFLDPAWSPDGMRMLFTQRGGGASFIMDLSRSFQEQQLTALPLLSNDGGQFTAYNWSPDGQRIAGVEWRKGKDVPGIVVFDLASQRYERLNYEGDTPYWLPDSRRLLYTHNQKIYWLDSATRTSRELLSHAEEILETPSLSRDGRFLYYGANSNEESIWLVTLK